MARRKRDRDRRCPHHAPRRQGLWGALQEDAERRMERGERQSQCPKCGYWLWPDEIGEEL